MRDCGTFSISFGSDTKNSIHVQGQNFDLFLVMISKYYLTDII